jgi:hypothetical protein
MARLVASAGAAPIHDLLAQYERECAAGLAVHATPFVLH